MADTRHCPTCGSVLPDDAPSGLCPKCLLQGGFATDPPAGSKPSAPTQSHAESPASHFTPLSPAELASRFPQLEIQALLGHGGMGAVYKARQPALDRLVAVKILPPEAGQDPAFGERFAREARAMARLNHPHIVSVYDFGQSGGQFYLVMEFVDGVNLREAIRSGSVTPQAALEIVSEICDALQYAHDEGVVHRDIKPENVLLDRRGRVKIADFGLAKLRKADVQTHDLTGTHQVMGTPRYMAPEQLEGSRDVDHRADIYSLGVVFYELLTGEVPMGRFQPPSTKVAVDVRVDEVVLKSLEREPERRYQHASEVKTDVERCSGTQFQPAQPGTASLTDADNDFILMNPRLPRVAQWITVYTIVVRPVMWLLVMLFGALGFELSLAGDYAEAAIDHAMESFAGLAQLVFVVVVALGGFKLRAQGRAGARWINVGLGLGFGLGLLIFILQLTITPQMLEAMREVAQTNPEQLVALGFTQQEIGAILSDKEYPILVPDLISVFFAAVWLVLDIAAFVWLWRNGSHLPLQAAPTHRRAAPEVIEPQEPRLSKLAVASVVATLPTLFLLCYLFFTLAQQGVPGPLQLIKAPDFGEVAATFLLVPGVSGIALGAAALYRIQNSSGRLHGIYLAAAAVVFFSVLALNAFVIPLLASIISLAFGTLSEEELRGPKGLLWMWSILLPIAAIDYLIGRRAWRRLIGKRSQP